MIILLGFVKKDKIVTGEKVCLMIVILLDSQGEVEVGQKREGTWMVAALL